MVKSLVIPDNTIQSMIYLKQLRFINNWYCTKLAPKSLHSHCRVNCLCQWCWDQYIVFHFSQIWIISLSVGTVRNICPELWNFQHLRSLYLNDNNLCRLPPDISKLTNLSYLDLSSNKLRSLPAELGDLVHLRELLLHKNYLRVLPFEIGKLFNLQILGEFKYQPNLGQKDKKCLLLKFLIMNLISNSGVLQ